MAPRSKHCWSITSPENCLRVCLLGFCFHWFSYHCWGTLFPISFASFLYQTTADLVSLSLQSSNVFFTSSIHVSVEIISWTPTRRLLWSYVVYSKSVRAFEYYIELWGYTAMKKIQTAPIFKVNHWNRARSEGLLTSRLSATLRAKWRHTEQQIQGQSQKEIRPWNPG